MDISKNSVIRNYRITAYIIKSYKLINKSMENQNNQIIIYSDASGQTKIEVKLEDETLWLSQKQMAELFDKNVPTINEHIKNIFSEGELEENRTIRKFRIVRFRDLKYN